MRKKTASRRRGVSGRRRTVPAAVHGEANAPDERRVTSPVAVSALLVDEEETRRTRSGSRKNRNQRLAVVVAAKNAHRDRASDHGSQPFRGDRGEGPGLTSEADGHEPDGQHQRVARRRAGGCAGHGVRQRASGGSSAHGRGRDAGCFCKHSQLREPPASAAGDHDPGARRPR